MTEEVQVVEEVVEETLVGALTSKIMEVTKCDQEAANELTVLIGAVVADSIQVTLSDVDFTRQLYTNMLITQVNANQKLANIESTISKAEWVVVDEEHPTADISVTYVSEDSSEWVFKRRSDEGWSILEMSEEGRTRMVAIVGKFFDNRPGRVGYIVDAHQLTKEE